jgi:hypothetical protein
MAEYFGLLTVKGLSNFKNKTTGNKAYRYRLEKISGTWFFNARLSQMSLTVTTS